MQTQHHHTANMLSWQKLGKPILSVIAGILAVLGLAACSMTDTVATNDTTYAYEIELLEGDTPALIEAEYQVEVVEWDSDNMVAIILSPYNFDENLSTQGRSLRKTNYSASGNSGWAN